MPILYYISPAHIYRFSKFKFFFLGGGKFPLFLKFLDSTKLYCVIHFLSQVWGSLPIHAHAKAFNTPKKFFGGNFPPFFKFIDFTKLYCMICFLSLVWGSLSIHVLGNAFQTSQEKFLLQPPPPPRPYPMALTQF